MTHEKQPGETLPRTGAVRRGLILAGLAIAMRIALILMPGADVSPAWVLPEEVHRGNVAQELIQGPLLDPQDYQFAPSTGGSLAISVLAIPFVAVLGPNLVALRMPTILLHGIAVVLLFVLLDRWAGRRAAWLGGALFAVGPPGYVLLTITAWGTHHEVNTLALLALLLFLDLHARSSEGRTLLRGLWIGMVTGIASYFELSFLGVLAALGCLAFLEDRGFPFRRWFAGAVGGFLIGYAPGLRFAWLNDGQALTLYEGPPIVLPHVSEVLNRMADLCTRFLPDSLFLGRHVTGSSGLGWAGLGWAGLGCQQYCSCTDLERRRSGMHVIRSSPHAVGSSFHVRNESHPAWG